MSRTLGRRVARLEAGRGDPGAALTMSDLLNVIEAGAATEERPDLLEEVGALAEMDAEEAGWRAYRTRPDVAASCPPPELTPGRWPYLRAKHLWRDTTYPGDGPRPAATPEELAARLAAWLAREGLPSGAPRTGAKGRTGAAP